MLVNFIRSRICFIIVCIPCILLDDDLFLVFHTHCLVVNVVIILYTTFIAWWWMLLLSCIPHLLLVVNVFLVLLCIYFAFWVSNLVSYTPYWFYLGGKYIHHIYFILVVILLLTYFHFYVIAYILLATWRYGLKIVFNIWFYYQRLHNLISYYVNTFTSNKKIM